MEVSSRLFLLLISLLSLLFQLSDSAASVVVDGVSVWRNPTADVGDTIIFKSKYNYKLYIFRNREAFDLCNFTQAVLLTKPNSASYTWHPSRLGFFYFAFNNGSATPCQRGQKLAITVSLSRPGKSASAPVPSPAEAPVRPFPATPAPASGGVVSSSPAYPWPFQPHESTPPSSAPTADLPVEGPGKGDGIPFINSNPAVPLPTGAVDSATTSPQATSGHGGKVVVGLAVQVALCFVVLLALL